MFVFLVSWLVLSLVVGVLIGKAIHRADAIELAGPPAPRPAEEHRQPGAPRLVAAVATPESPSSTDTQTHAQAA